MRLLWDVKDGAYTGKVIAPTAYGGTLTIWRNKAIVYTAHVTLAYGAMFGPDVADVAEWNKIMDKIMEIHQ